MKTVEDIKLFYKNSLKKELDTLEALRLKQKQKISIIAAVAAIITIGLYIYFKDSAINEESHLVFILVVGFIATYGISYGLLSKKFVALFKKNIFKPVIDEIGENLTYSTKEYVSRELIDASNLYPAESRYKGNDLIKGTIQGVNIEFSDLNVEYTDKSTPDSKSKMLFNGLFIVAEFNKNFTSSTKIHSLKDGLDDKILNFIFKGSSNSKTITMDNPEFEKNFSVLSDDDREVYYILTHTMMEALLRLKEASKGFLVIKFSQGNMYIGINGADNFEPSLFNSLVEDDKIIEFFKPLFLALNIIEELQLNQKLWSKY